MAFWRRKLTCAALCTVCTGLHSPVQSGVHVFARSGWRPELPRETPAGAMRVRFSADPSDAEVGLQLCRLRSGVAFWQELESALSSSKRSLDGARRTLAEIDPDLELEIGDGTVAVCALGDGGAHTLAEDLVARAPSLPGWELRTERPPRTLAEAVESVARSTGVDLRGAQVRVGVTRGHLLDVVLRADGVVSADDERARLAAQRLCRLHLGDAVFSDWIGAVDVEPKPRQKSLLVVQDSTPAEWLPLTELEAAVFAARKGISSNLARAPYHTHCEHANWVLFELEPERGVDPNAVAAQDDLIVASTMLPEMWKCYLQTEPFASRRFSAVGEHFIFVKYRSELDDDEMRLAEREHLEEALNYRMVPARLGCVVGAGIGLHYGYVVLALEQLEQSIPFLVATLREQRAPRASWILFCDDRLRREWLGVWPNSGAPPTM